MELEQVFLRSPFWLRTRDHLSTISTPIENIVCLALCELRIDDPKYESKAPLTQHLFACAMSRFFPERNGGTPVLIIAHDPAYTQAYLRVFANLSPSIDVVSDPYHFLAITPKTLVINIYMPVFVPVYDVIANICSPRPAAMISLELEDYPWHKEGKISPYNDYLPRTTGRIRKYESTWLGDANSDKIENRMKMRAEGMAWTQDVWLHVWNDEQDLEEDGKEDDEESSSEPLP